MAWRGLHISQPSRLLLNSRRLVVEQGPGAEAYLREIGRETTAINIERRLAERAYLREMNDDMLRKAVEVF